MKLSPLLAQFLYLNRELNLTGIGRFQLVSSPENDVFEDKNSKKSSIGEISFVHDTSVKEDENLILFISSHSGKMKSLAAADLDSYLELAKQFLNIGKPFLIEGIGSLTKNQSGNLDFTQGQFSEKIKDISSVNTDQTSTTEDSFTNYEEMLSPKKPKAPASKKIVLWLTILTGIGLAIWGGYIVYSKTKKSETKFSEEAIPDTATSQITNISTSLKPDTVVLQKTDSSYLSGTYNFIIETANRSRAFTRYNDLKKWGIDIQMETKDSVRFNLFFKLVALPKDTTRIKDSLTELYGSMGKTRIGQ